MKSSEPERVSEKASEKGTALNRWASVTTGESSAWGRDDFLR
jgi:hypothetical protein